MKFFPVTLLPVVIIGLLVSMALLLGIGRWLESSHRVQGSRWQNVVSVVILFWGLLLIGAATFAMLAWFLYISP